jgi:hypothetical protein
MSPGEESLLFLPQSEAVGVILGVFGCSLEEMVYG